MLGLAAECLLDIPWNYPEQFYMNFVFLQGPRGYQGGKGDAGRSCAEQQQYFSGTLVVRHSQSTTTPRCDAGQYKLWDGYSLLYVEGNEKSHHQDLGTVFLCICFLPTSDPIAI